MQKLNLKKVFLNLLIGSVAVSALLGIIVILMGDFGEFESRILATTFTITCTSILGLACGAKLESDSSSALGLLGIVFSVVSAIVWIIMIWAEFNSGYFFGRFVMSATVLAVTFSHLSLISLARLDKRFAWAHISICIAVAALVGLILALIWGENFESDLVMRALGVLSIVVAALTIMIPVFHKLSDNVHEEEVIDAEIESLQNRISELRSRKKTISKNEADS